MSNGRSASRANEMRTRFAGSLADVSIGDLFQTLEMSAKPSEIEFDTDVGRATVWFREREVIDAVCGEITGADAIYRLAMADDGIFAANFDKKDHPQKFQLSPQRLLMEAARRRDEWLDRVGEDLRPATRIAIVGAATRNDLLGDDDQALLQRIGRGVQLVDLIPPGDDEAIRLAKPIRALLAAGVLQIVELPPEGVTEVDVPAPAPGPEEFWVTAFAAYCFGSTGLRTLLRALAVIAMLVGSALGLAWWSGRVLLGGQLIGWALLFLGNAISRAPQLPFTRPLLFLSEPLVSVVAVLDRVGVKFEFVGRGRALAQAATDGD